MPELPEVEHFRSLLISLISSSSSSSSSSSNSNSNSNSKNHKQPLQLERCTLDKKPPRKFISDEDIATLNQQQYYLANVLRKGKLIAMQLVKQQHGDDDDDDDDDDNTTKYLMVHMGMTGRISTPDHVPQLESLNGDEYPPPHTYLKFTCGDQEACFSDPRKFGSVQLISSIGESSSSSSSSLLETTGGFQSLAPDAYSDVNDQTKPDLIQKMSNQSVGIKALLLDQKRVVSGVGNWVADEVLYQTRIHPDQTYLTTKQATNLLETLHSILSTAISCLVEKKEKFPKDWLFHYRWNNKKTTKDAHGRVVTFVTSGGRTSAIVPSLQQKCSQVPSRKIDDKGPAVKKSSARKRARSDVSKGGKTKDDNLPAHTTNDTVKAETIASSVNVKIETAIGKDATSTTTRKRNKKEVSIKPQRQI